MELHKIEENLNNPDFQHRLKAVSALKDYESDVAVPLLTSKLRDQEFLVRSFVAMGLGKQQTAESFAALMQIMKFDDNPNVRAEASNSLSLFGRVAASHLVLAFYKDDHWLVRRSILGALADLQCYEELFDVCLEAIKGEDTTVRESAVDALGMLSSTNQRVLALSQLLLLTSHESERIRIHVAYALKQFDEPPAREALEQLRQDTDHRVVAAALEDLLEE
ncbi:HEAT repeat domain-containing protein [Calothrix rhizosoleniae]|uniref:HEAT repeat domain-containing protein n=1 Tax=Calothrix rhizosoleniae TaxID=888997 RepID=UPI000B4A319F|nr:HEAT repeat domain-containing protein [Calothrix rhizosoleniae]